jgi:hypothetical protein
LTCCRAEKQQRESSRVREFEREQREFEREQEERVREFESSRVREFESSRVREFERVRESSREFEREFERVREFEREFESSRERELESKKRERGSQPQQANKYSNHTREVFAIGEQHARIEEHLERGEPAGHIEAHTQPFGVHVPGHVLVGPLFLDLCAESTNAFHDRLVLHQRGARSMEVLRGSGKNAIGEHSF